MASLKPKAFLQSVLSLCFPPLCLHCGGYLTGNVHHFCSTCITLLDLIDPYERCPRCFSADYCRKRRLCGRCSQEKLPLTALASAFEHTGPAATLVQLMKYGGQRYLAKGAAAYMALQFHTLQWPFPDVIVPVPISWVRRFDRGYNQSADIAAELSLLLDRPVLDCLRRPCGGYSQAGLTRKLRLQLDADAFRLKKGAGIEDRSVLLVDDVTTTGTTLGRCAEALQEECPAVIYAMTFCKA